MSHFEKWIFILTFQILEFSRLKHPKLHMILPSKLTHIVCNFKTLFYVITDDIALTVIGQFLDFLVESRAKPIVVTENSARLFWESRRMLFKSWTYVLTLLEKQHRVSSATYGSKKVFKQFQFELLKFSVAATQKFFALLIFDSQNWENHQKLRKSTDCTTKIRAWSLPI